ncbi:MAG: TonB-dependent receptor plug domain-containing protein [Tannerella sp.]|jgi:TonB-dependent SusC/RagA subfamily outer membrane receptor|nr:TonB-dependent receptor plug domain-containing protein [Tannerella sp.]
MENLGDDFFFKKNIRIGSITAFQISNLQSTNQNQRVVTRKYDFDVSFFPEGGNLVEEVFNTVAFKALNRSGYTENIAGNIVDENGAEITSVQTLHAGMGVFSYVPESGKRYYLKCRNGNGLEKQFELPKSDHCMQALSVTRNQNRISVGIRKSPNSTGNPLYLLAQCRGEVLYFSAWDNKNEYISFSADGFPSGITQFVLFDEQMNPLSERLVFSKNDDDTKVVFQTNKDIYEKREKVITSLKLPLTLLQEGETPSISGRVGERLGHFSVSVTDDKDMAVDASITILSSLLLSSELKGHIDNPAWYLQDNIQSATALDYLMMTHGWRRYNIPEVVRGNPEFPKIPYQTGQQISGKVRGLLSRPVSGSEVLIVTEDGSYGITSTDEKGVFMFQGFEYPDSASFMIQALRNWVKLVIDEESFPVPVHVPQSSGKTIPVINEETENEPETNVLIVKAEQRARYDEDMRMIHLGELEVTAPRIDRKEEHRLEFWANRSSDYTIRREQLDKLYYHHIAQYITFIPGVNVSQDTENPWHYNVSVCPTCGPPAILLDGIPVETMDDISPDMVESIDVLKFASATGLGVRGANGVISITTRKGETNSEVEKLNQSVHTPLGYQKPVEFYSPKYDTQEAQQSPIPDYRTTIFWKPDVVISDEHEEATFEFYTSDYPTTYSIVIEGLTTDCKIVRQVKKIRVE